MRDIVLFLVAYSATFPVFGQAPPTFQEALAKEGIGTANPSLIVALNDARPLVRGLAAGQLAENKDRDAIPAIEKALDREQVPEQRLNMAGALISLGDARGRVTLVDLCKDDHLREDLRLMAATEINPPEGRCTSAIVKLLSKADNPAEQLAELSYLLDKSADHIKAFAAGDAFIMTLRSALKSEWPPMREAAAKCIGKFSITALEWELKEALDSEEDSEVQTSMRLSSKQLFDAKQAK